MMRSIQLTTNKSLIKEVIEEEYDRVTYDGCPSFQDFEPEVENCLWFLLKYEGEIAGLIKLESMNYVTWIPHIIIKKNFRSNQSTEWGQLVMTYMRTRLKDVTFMALTPYEAAKDYAERLGFKLVGKLPKSIKKNGELMDQYILVGGTQ